MRRSLAVILLLILSISVAGAQEAEPVDCETYTDTLGRQLNVLNVRLSAFANAPSALNSDYLAWQERRLGWEATEPPECALTLHDDVIAMYAGLGDIAAIGLWLQLDPDSRANQRLAQEVVERAGERIEQVADDLEAITGADVDVGEVAVSLEEIAERIAAG